MNLFTFPGLRCILSLTKRTALVFGTRAILIKTTGIGGDPDSPNIIIKRLPGGYIGEFLFPRKDKENGTKATDLGCTACILDDGPKGYKGVFMGDTKFYSQEDHKMTPLLPPDLSYFLEQNQGIVSVVGIIIILAVIVLTIWLFKKLDEEDLK